MLIRYYWPFGNLLLSNSSQTCSTQTDKSLGHFSWIMLEPNLFHHYSQGSRCHVLLDSRHFPLSLSQCPEWLLLLNNLKQLCLNNHRIGLNGCQDFRSEFSTMALYVNIWVMYTIVSLPTLMQPFFVETNVCYYLGILCYFKRFAVGFIIKIHQSPEIFNLLRYWCFYCC